MAQRSINEILDELKDSDVFEGDRCIEALREARKVLKTIRRDFEEMFIPEVYALLKKWDEQ